MPMFLAALIENLVQIPRQPSHGWSILYLHKSHNTPLHPPLKLCKITVCNSSWDMREIEEREIENNAYANVFRVKEVHHGICASRECLEMRVIRCTKISISATKCPLALFINFNITRVSEYNETIYVISPG